MAGARLKVLHPDSAYNDDNENNRSLVCRLDWQGRRHLLTGDIEAEAEAWLMERYPDELAADIVDRGIVLTGGGALYKNLDKLLREETGLPVIVADDPLSTVARGAGKLLDDIDLLKDIMISS